MKLVPEKKITKCERRICPYHILDEVDEDYCDTNEGGYIGTFTPTEEKPFPDLCPLQDIDENELLDARLQRVCREYFAEKQKEQEVKS